MARAATCGHALGASLRRILCVAAHPDDHEFTIGGTVARWAREGRDVAFCLVTTGGAGVNEHTPSNEGLIPIREKETRAAAKILGMKTCSPPRSAKRARKWGSISGRRDGCSGSSRRCRQ